MNKSLYFFSESIVLSLCKEIEYIRNRTKNINYSLKYCQNKNLTKRLHSELNKLNKTRLKIKKISKNLFILNNNLASELLIEMTKRSNSLQQI